MKDVKAAFYLRVTTDATIMAKLNNIGPFPGRHPLDAPTSRDVATITYEGETTLTRGFKENITLTLHIWAFRHDLVEDVAVDLDRLFHPTASSRGQWVPLTVTSGRAFTRREFAIDVPDRQSPLFHKAIRFRILFAKAA